MSGGHYNYAYQSIQDCGNDIESDATRWSAPHFDDWGDKRDPLPADILAIMRRAVTVLRVASKMAHDIEWYMSGDYGDDTLRACAEGWQDGHAERDALQAAGLHPAPCARSCEANAYEIEIRRLKSDNAILRALIDTLV